MPEVSNSNDEPLAPYTREQVQVQTMQNLLIGIAHLSAELIPADKRGEWSERFTEFADNTAATYKAESVEREGTSKLTKPIEWRQNWMGELPNWNHEHWGGLTPFGSYIVQVTKSGEYMATGFSASSYIGMADTPEAAFEMCQVDIDFRIKEMLL